MTGLSKRAGETGSDVLMAAGSRDDDVGEGAGLVEGMECSLLVLDRGSSSSPPEEAVVVSVVSSMELEGDERVRRDDKKARAREDMLK